MPDPGGLALTVLFLAAGLLIIPLDKRWVRRQNERRRHQAHPRRRA